jgi:hypothetical protein
MRKRRAFQKLLIQVSEKNIYEKMRIIGTTLDVPIRFAKLPAFSYLAHQVQLANWSVKAHEVLPVLGQRNGFVFCDEK